MNGNPATEQCPHGECQLRAEHFGPCNTMAQPSALSSKQQNRLQDQSTAAVRVKLRRFLLHIADGGDSYYHDDGFPRAAMGEDAAEFVRLLDAGEMDRPAVDTTTGLTIADYESVLSNYRRLVRELDVLIFGDEAASQASLCDLVAHVSRDVNAGRLVRTLGRTP